VGFHFAEQALNWLPMDQSAKAKERKARQQRLGRALRENLKRRKAQSRGRADEPAAAVDAVDGAPSDTRLSPQSRSD
jgi:hypothetical protein